MSLDAFLEVHQGRGEIDLGELRSYSRVKGGFQSNRLRRKVWPLLLGVSRYEDDKETLVASGGIKCLIDETHEDVAQVQLDIARALWSQSEKKSWDEEKLGQMRGRLSNIILAIISQNRSLHYFQGYHDVCSVLLLVMAEEASEADKAGDGDYGIESSDFFLYRMTRALTETYFVDSACSDFTTVTRTMSFILAIVRLRDTELHDFLREAQVPPFFATSWLITWFSHDIEDFEEVARLFDACLSSPPFYCLYVCAAFVLLNRNRILEVECDFAMAHNALSKGVERWGLAVEEVITLADQLMQSLHYQRVIPLERHLARLQWRGVVHMFDNAVLCDPTASFNRVVAQADWAIMAMARGEKRKIRASQLLQASGVGVMATISRRLTRSSALVAVGILEAIEFLLCVEDENTCDYVYDDDTPLHLKALRWAENYPRALLGKVFVLSGDKTAALVAVGFGVAAWLAHQ